MRFRVRFSTRTGKIGSKWDCYITILDERAVRDFDQLTEHWINGKSGGDRAVWQSYNAETAAEAAEKAFKAAVTAAFDLAGREDGEVHYGDPGARRASLEFEVPMPTCKDAWTMDGQLLPAIRCDRPARHPGRHRSQDERLEWWNKTEMV